MQSNWKGFLKLSLVSIPVKAFSAQVATARPQLNQLHAECHSRIRYQKTCPIHGEVTKDEIVMGFEYAKGQYVELDKEELDELRGERERSITIDAVVPADTIDPLYFTEKSYYLVPDGKVGIKPFALIREGLTNQHVAAVGHGTLFGREEVLLLRALDDVLSLTALKYEAEVRDTSELGTFDEPPLNKQEVALTKTLLAAYAKDEFSLAEYNDHYAEHLAELVAARIKGKKVVKPPGAAEQPQVINLIDALKKSLSAKGTSRSRPPAKPRRKSG